MTPLSQKVKDSITLRSGIKCGCLYCSTVPPLCANLRCWKSDQDPAVILRTRTGPSRCVDRLFSNSTFRRQLGLHLCGQAVGTVGRSQIGFFDQQAVVGRIAPGRQHQKRPKADSEPLLGRGNRGDDLKLGELLAGDTRDMGTLVQELDDGALAVKADAADQVEDLVAIETPAVLGRI